MRLFSLSEKNCYKKGCGAKQNNRIGQTRNGKKGIYYNKIANGRFAYELSVDSFAVML